MTTRPSDRLLMAVFVITVLAVALAHLIHRAWSLVS